MINLVIITLLISHFFPIIISDVFIISFPFEYHEDFKKAVFFGIPLSFIIGGCRLYAL